MLVFYRLNKLENDRFNFIFYILLHYTYPTDSFCFTYSPDVLVLILYKLKNK